MIKIIHNSLFLISDEEQDDGIFFLDMFFFSSCRKIEQWMRENSFTAILSSDQKMAFKLIFDQPDQISERANILIPIIRRLMPNIIANKIIGVQPMTNVVPSNLKFTFK